MRSYDFRDIKQRNEKAAHVAHHHDHKSYSPRINLRTIYLIMALTILLLCILR